MADVIAVDAPPRLPLDLQLLVLDAADAADQQTLAAVCRTWRSFLVQSAAARAKRYLVAAIDHYDLSSHVSDSRWMPASVAERDRPFPKTLWVHRQATRHVQLFSFQIQPWQRRDDGSVYHMVVCTGDEKPFTPFADDPLFLVDPATEETPAHAPRVPTIFMNAAKWRYRTSDKLVEGNYTLWRQPKRSPFDRPTVGAHLAPDTTNPAGHPRAGQAEAARRRRRRVRYYDVPQAVREGYGGGDA